jgi:hypothetical protein
VMDAGEHNEASTAHQSHHRVARRVAPSARRISGRVRGWVTARHVVQASLRVFIPVVLFGRFHRFRYLDPRRAAEMMVFDDWTTYVVGPNYLRTAPNLSFPLGRIPDYLAPAGSSIGKVDSLPILTPVYRLAMAVFPGQPIQLVGAFLLVAFILAFNMVSHFVDLIDVELHFAVRECLTLGFAATLTIAPFWNLQYVHPALMQQWILIWALVSALRRCPTFLEGRFRRSDSRWAGLGPILVASVVQPYLIPMAALPALAPDIADIRIRPMEVLRKVAVAGALSIGLAFAMGFIGDGGNLGSDGFGGYAGDLLGPVDPDLQSRLVLDVPGTVGSIGGYAYAGLGGLFLALFGVVAAIGSTIRSRLLSVPLSRLEDGRLKLRLVGLSVAALLLYSALPTLRIAGRPILDLSRIFNNLESVTAIFRVNGRFVWMAVWLAMLVGIARLVIRWRPRTVLIASLMILAIQIFDVIPWTPLARQPGDIEYEESLLVLREAAASGATEVQFQPPVVVPGCYSPEYGSFTALGDVLLAASVIGLPVNSGYTARLSPEFTRLNCELQVEEFVAGEFRSDVLYIVPGSAATSVRLECFPVTSELQGCRSNGP